MRPLAKRIDRAALRYNWHRIRQRAAARRLLAVVKSDAYGHGLAAVADALRGEADGFAVVALADAVALRQQGIEKPIVLLQGIFDADNAPALAAHRLTPVIHSEWQVQALAQLPQEAALTVYLKINSGMNRLGFAPDEASALLQALQTLPAVADIVLMTHLANADCQDGIAAQELAALRAHGLPVSIGNSAATLLHDDFNDDWGRIGIALYGASPAPHWRSREELGLQAAMTFRTALIATRRLAAGERIGYGGEFTAPGDMPVGIASVGYGDGYPRRRGLAAAVGDAVAPVIGRVSMEMIALDLSNCPGARIGDEVILWGSAPSVDEVAAAADTIAYDLLTAARGALELA